jgi:hypothetical protein
MNSNINRATDNYFMDFPAIMQDGRSYTDYKPSCVMNKDSIGMTSFEYRNFLTRNADKIIQNNTKLLNELGGCGQCSDYSVVPPYVVMSCDKDNCIQHMRSPNGLGMEIQASIDSERHKKIDYIKHQLLDHSTAF